MFTPLTWAVWLQAYRCFPKVIQLLFGSGHSSENKQYSHCSLGTSSYVDKEIIFSFTSVKGVCISIFMIYLFICFSGKLTHSTDLAFTLFCVVDQEMNIWVSCPHTNTNTDTLKQTDTLIISHTCDSGAHTHTHNHICTHTITYSHICK